MEASYPFDRGTNIDPDKIYKKKFLCYKQAAGMFGKKIYVDPELI